MHFRGNASRPKVIATACFVLSVIFVVSILEFR